MDQLEEAIKAKVRECEFNGKKLMVRKWTYRLGLTYTGKLLEAAKTFSKTQVGDDLAALLKTDLAAFAASFTDLIEEVLVGTVQPGNFKDKAEAKAWVDELSMEEVLDLFILIAEMNFRPLVEKVQALKGKLGGAQASKVPAQPQT